MRKKLPRGTYSRENPYRHILPRTGHIMLCFYENGRRFAYYEHRAVWEAAFGPIPPGYDVHHDDLNTQNNELDNLQCLPAGQHSRLHNLGVVRANYEGLCSNCGYIGHLCPQWELCSPCDVFFRTHRQHRVPWLGIRTSVKVARALRVRRMRERGWSLSRIAAEVGIDQSTVSRIVNGKTYALLDTGKQAC